MSQSQVWEQSAFWYLAGMEDGRHVHDVQRGELFPHGPTTPEGKRFIRAYVAACEAAEGGCWPYLPDFYREWLT